jgi:hypothetical protein
MSVTNQSSPESTPNQETPESTLDHSAQEHVIETPFYKKRGFVIAGTLTAAGGLLAAALVLDKNSEEHVSTTPDSTSSAEPTTTPSPSVSETEGIVSNIPRVEVEGGWADTQTALGIVTPSLERNDILAKRPNGDTILVPRLRVDSPSEFADSFLTLWAAYVTTGDEEVLSEVSTGNPNVRELLIRSRESFGIADAQESPTDRDASMDMQMIIYGSDPFFLSGVSDSYNDSGEFVTNEQYIELDPSTPLFVIRTPFNDTNLDISWQARNQNYYAGPGARFDTLRVEYAIDDFGAPSITGFDYHYSSVERASE